IFVAPPSVDVQRRRLAGRGTESAGEQAKGNLAARGGMGWGRHADSAAEKQAKRNLDAEPEMARAADFDYVVVNETDQPEATADQIDQIIRHEHERAPDRQIKLWPSEGGDGEAPLGGGCG